MVKTFIDEELMQKVRDAENAREVAEKAAEKAAEEAAEKAAEKVRAEVMKEAEIKIEETIKNSVLALIPVMGTESISKALNISVEKVEKIISGK